MGKRKIGIVFQRLYIRFIVMILVIYACTILIFATYAASQRSTHIQAMQTTVQQGAAVLKEQLDIVADLEKMLVSDSRTEELGEDVNLDGYQKSQLALGLIGSMRNMQSMNYIIKEIAILFPHQEMELSTGADVSRKECIPAPRQESDTARSLVYKEGQVQMELWYPLTRSIVEDHVPDYGVRVTLSEEYLDDLLVLFSVEKGSGGFSVLNRGGELLQIPVHGEDAERVMECWRREWEEADSPSSFLGRGRCLGKSLFFVSEEIPEYGITLVSYRDDRWLDGSIITALLVMGGVILLFGGLFLMMLRQTDEIVNKPLQKVVQAFEKVQEGDLSIRISHKYQDEFQYIYSAFNKMVERIGELIENVKEQAKLLQNAELMQLQSQINPHFLYNSFYLIRIMAKNESYEQITGFVTSLAKYYRFLNKEVEQNIPLSREAEHMGNYIDIQQMRFGDKITVEVEKLPEGAAAFLVPKLILQPVVENAYNYGMADILQDGRIQVGYEIKEGFLYIRIEDNGSGGSEENLERMREYIRDYQGRAAGHALSNIERRLKLSFGEESGIFLEKSSLGGLLVTLRMDMSVLL